MKRATLFSDGAYHIDLAYPHIGDLFPSSLVKLNLHEAIRWLIQLPFGYRVYCLFDGNTEIGYYAVGGGGNPRYPFAGRPDIILGPMYIEPAYRGKGLASLLRKKACEHEKGYRSAISFIKHDNTPSIKSVLSSGFHYVSDCSYTKYTRRLLPVSGVGQMQLYKLEGEIP